MMDWYNKALPVYLLLVQGHGCTVQVVYNTSATLKLLFVTSSNYTISCQIIQSPWYVFSWIPCIDQYTEYVHSFPEIPANNPSLTKSFFYPTFLPSFSIFLFQRMLPPLKAILAKGHRLWSGFPKCHGHSLDDPAPGGGKAHHWAAVWERVSVPTASPDHPWEAPAILRQVHHWPNDTIHQPQLAASETQWCHPTVRHWEWAHAKIWATPTQGFS